MACKACNSENLQRLDGELTASLPVLKGLKASPLYVCQSILVCMDCGFAELVIPTSELLSLKNAKAASGF
jgi:prolyl-tRNA editing enzyme YbaK/EbsC (Cys-tRNA(Pro) deacylase)